MSKTIALFGGSGRTGQQFLEQALQAGYAVRALARSPQKITQKSGKLTVIQGDVLNQADVSAVVEGADLVVSLFGQVKGSPDDVQTRGTQHIVTAMKEHGIKRIFSLSGGGLPYEKDQPGVMDHLIRGIMKLFTPALLNDAKGHVVVLEKSGLDWTIVRGPRLTNGPHTGKYRIGWVGVNSGTQISRADLAEFMLKLVQDDSFKKEMPFVSY